jgi:hypothetical protein
MIYITDDNALHALGMVEGPDWKHYQYTHKESEQGFFWLRSTYQELKVEFTEGDEPLDPIITAHLILYGAAGYSRYKIRSTGEIVLLANTTRAEKVATAKALGITVLECAAPVSYVSAPEPLRLFG